MACWKKNPRCHSLLLLLLLLLRVKPAWKCGFVHILKSINTQDFVKIHPFTPVPKLFRKRKSVMDGHTASGQLVNNMSTLWHLWENESSPNMDYSRTTLLCDLQNYSMSPQQSKGTSLKARRKRFQLHISTECEVIGGRRFVPLSSAVFSVKVCQAR